MSLHLHLKHAKAALRIALACALGLALAALHATPITPTRDDEVIELLPAMAGGRSEQRRLRQQLARQPRDAALALALAQRYLDQAHRLGDPRFAGMALSAIGAWSDDATTPDGILMMRSTLQQYLHEFDASGQSLQHLLARPGAPRPQAWLTLATVRRVQGRYADSDLACHQVALSGAMLYASACLAENEALRGDVSRARDILQTLITSGTDRAQTRAWLTTSLAELEQRAGHPVAADAAYRASLALDPDSYTTLAYADFLIEQRRPAQALALLKGQGRSDAVLLRLAIAGTQAHATSAPADAAEMRERIALANERPDAKVFHGREQAMFALTVDRDIPRALELARGNVVRQREPLDLLVLAQAARTSGLPAALEEARRLTREIGLVDQRINAIL
jgi:thioredoxin-like negative regulator of GroEL